MIRASDIGAVTYRGGVTVTPSNTTADPNGPFDALQCTGMAGVCKVTALDGNDVVIYLPQGVIVPIAVSRVWSTGTDATGVIGLKGAVASV